MTPARPVPPRAGQQNCPTRPASHQASSPSAATVVPRHSDLICEPQPACTVEAATVPDGEPAYVLPDLIDPPA